MKICVLTSRFPYPIEKGDKLRIYHQIRMLSQEHQIILISLTDQPVSEAEKEHMRAFVDEIHVFSLSKSLIPFHLIKSLLINQPFQIGYFYRKKIHYQIQEIIEYHQPDHIYCQLIRMTEYVRHIQLPKTLDYMDCFSAGMARQAKEGKAFLAPIYRRESRLLTAYQQEVYADFQHHTIISEQDKTLLDPKGNLNISVVPNGIDTDFFRLNTTAKAQAEIVFVGNMGYFPNIKAAQFLVQNIMPLVWESIPQASVIIAGARPHTSVQMLAKNELVTVTGWIEDIRDAYVSGQLFLAPIFTGSGQQNKILEAMALGRPCITTPLVNNAIHAKAGEEIAIAETEEAFAKQVTKLLTDENARVEMATQGRQFVEKYMSWEKAIEPLHQFFDPQRIDMKMNEGGLK